MVLITFLSSNPIIAVIVLIAFAFAFIALLFTNKSFTLNLGENKSISIGSSAKDKQKDNKTLVKSCKFCRERIKNITKTRVKTIIELRNETFHRQMKNFENGLDRLMLQLLEEYKEWLKIRKPHSADIETDLEYVIVVDKIKICMVTRVLSGIKQMLKENHLAEKTDDSWEIYKAEAKQTIKSDVFRFIEVNFIPGYSVNREEQSKFFSARWVMIGMELDRCFNQARSLAIECVTKTVEIKSKSDDEIYNLD